MKITDALGTSIEAYTAPQPYGTPRIVVEIEEGEVANVHLTPEQALSFAASIALKALDAANRYRPAHERVTTIALGIDRRVVG